MDHGDLIDRLGGPTALGKLLGGVSGKAVHNWKTRGVAPEYRYAVSLLAQARGIPLPSDFLKLPVEEPAAPEAA